MPMGAKGVTQRIVGVARQVLRPDGRDGPADRGIPLSRCRRDVGPGLPALDLRPPIGGEEEAGRGHEQHQADSDGSGQHARKGRDRAREHTDRGGYRPGDQVQASRNGHGVDLRGLHYDVHIHPEICDGK
jgi:hypothetical protein